MLDMAPCHTCHGAKVRKESLHVFLTIPENQLPKKSIWNDHNPALFVNK